MLSDPLDFSGSFPAEYDWYDGTPTAMRDDAEGICLYVEQQRERYIAPALAYQRRFVCVSLIAFNMVMDAGGLPPSIANGNFEDARDTVNKPLSTWIRWAYGRESNHVSRSMKHLQVRRITSLEHVMRTVRPGTVWTKDKLPWLIDFVTEKGFEKIIEDASKDQKPKKEPNRPALLPANPAPTIQLPAQPLLPPEPLLPLSDHPHPASGPEPELEPKIEPQPVSDACPDPEPTDEALEPEADETTDDGATTDEQFIEYHRQLFAKHMDGYMIARFWAYMRLCDLINNKGYKMVLYTPESYDSLQELIEIVTSRQDA